MSWSTRSFYKKAIKNSLVWNPVLPSKSKVLRNQNWVLEQILTKVSKILNFYCDKIVLFVVVFNFVFVFAIQSSARALSPMSSWWACTPRNVKTKTKSNISKYTFKIKIRYLCGRPMRLKTGISIIKVWSANILFLWFP